MEAMVEMEDTVGGDEEEEQKIALWLSQTADSQEAAVRTATQQLEAAQQTMPKFASLLLRLSAGGQEKGQRIASATYLKNFLRTHWTEGKLLSPQEQLEFRNQLVEVLLRVDGLVLKLLAEAFRLVAVHDFAKQKSWSELVPALKTAIHNSDLVTVPAPSEFKTLNVLIALQTIIKPFQYFVDPTVAREPAPEQLELISKELLAPLQAVFHHLVQEVASSKDQGFAQYDNILLVLCKCFYLATKSHMPPSLLLCLAPWIQDLMVLLDTIVLEKTVDSPDEEPRLKIWKRSLQICCNFVSRHRKHMDKYLPAISSAALKIVIHSLNAKDHPMQERILSLSFDLVSNILETGPGWRLMAPHFSRLLECAIFPALKMKEKDIVLWEEDEEEYLRKNLPSDLEHASGWKEELLMPRQSALNLLGLIATAKGPPTAGGVKKGAAMKRKKWGKAKGKDGLGTAGEVLVMPFLSQFTLPPDGALPSSEFVANYFGAVLAYGALHEFLKTQDTEIVATLLQTRIFPLYAMVVPSPYVLANSNWLLGELASCLPEDMNEDVYTALLKALLAPNTAGLSWRPVRASAAGALSSLLQKEYKPRQWLPLLQAAVMGAKMQDEEDATLSLQLLGTAAEAGEDDVAPHVPAITAAVQGEILRHIPPHPEPWPQIVELGFSALASLAQTWESFEPEEPDEDEDESEALAGWKVGCTGLANTFSHILQQAWLTPSQGEEALTQVAPPPSCLSDTSVLISTILRYTPDLSSAASMKVETLLQVWANLIVDWNAWEEEEDEAVFDAIEEAVALQEKHPMLHFTLAETESTAGLPVVPRSILECFVTFAIGAIESGYPSACWRACHCSYAFLHVSSKSCDGEQVAKGLVPRFTEVASRRLLQLTSPAVPLAKPLILLVSMCFIILPEAVVKILPVGEEDHNVTIKEDTSPGLLQWAEALASLSESESVPGLSLESEMKLAALGLQKVLEYMIQNNLTQDYKKGHTTAHHCFCALLKVTLDLKELLETSETEDDDSSEAGSEDEEEDDTEDDDDADEAEKSEESEEEHEETEEEFLERYAKTARELQEEAVEEAENGQDEDGHEIELGVLGLVDQEDQVVAFLKAHGKSFITQQPTLPEDLVTRFEEKFPDCKFYFCSS